jgi:mono/diheme cytochrome c family protein
MKKLALLTFFGFAILAGSASGAEAKALYDKHCAKCHGPDGKGKTKMGRQSGVKDYTDPKVQEEMKDDVALKTIKEGITEKGKERMKAYASELNDADIKGLIAYMRAFKK